MFASAPTKPGLETPDRERRPEHQALQVVRGEAHAQLPLEGGPIQRDSAEQLPLGGRRRERVGAQPLDERRPVRRRHRREQAGQDPCRVRHAEVPGVDVAASRLDLEGEGEDPPGSEHDRGPLARVLRPVRHEDEVSGEKLSVGVDEAAEAGAADLLLSLEHDLQVDPRGDAEGVHQREGLEVRPDRALVVGRPARVEPVRRQRVVRNLAGRHDRRAFLGKAGAEDRLEGRGLEPTGGRSGLGVEVAVDQEGPGGSGHQPGAEHHGVPPRLEHARLESPRAHGVGQPGRAGPDPLRLLAHRVDPEALGEALQDRAPPGPERAVERRPVHGDGEMRAAIADGCERPGRSGGCARASTRSSRRPPWRPRRATPDTREPSPRGPARR